MIALNPGNLCVHHFYTDGGKRDRFYIFPIDWADSDDMFHNCDNDQYYILAEEIFMILSSPTCVGGDVSSINILTSVGIIGTLIVNSIYHDRFAVIDGVY